MIKSTTTAGKGEHSPVISNDFAQLTFRGTAELIGEIQRLEENLGVAKEHRTVYLSHQHRTPKSFLLFNGLGRTTDELRELGESCAKVGNTIIPNSPFHGLPAGPKSLANLTTKRLVEFAKTTTQLGRALGDQVHNAGVSMGAAVSLYGSLSCPDVKSTVAIAPPFGLRGVKDWTLPWIMRALLVMPNRENFPIMQRRAPGGSTRATAAVGGLSLEVWKLLRAGPVSVSEPRRLLIVESKDDGLLNDQSTKRFCDAIHPEDADVQFAQSPEVAQIIHPKHRAIAQEHRRSGAAKTLLRTVHQRISQHFGLE